jgi:hypothetical protein
MQGIFLSRGQSERTAVMKKSLKRYIERRPERGIYRTQKDKSFKTG